mmetsp:Transcript_19286/g.31053  ORF Transcript_19286/g.31053 Transcript_19286/m.31053 type:complete len:83 (-) Transcript_19286:62-310(-)
MTVVCSLAAAELVRYVNLIVCRKHLQASGAVRKLSEISDLKLSFQMNIEHSIDNDSDTETQTLRQNPLPIFLRMRVCSGRQD